MPSSVLIRMPKQTTLALWCYQLFVTNGKTQIFHKLEQTGERCVHNIRDVIIDIVDDAKSLLTHDVMHCIAQMLKMQDRCQRMCHATEALIGHNYLDLYALDGTPY